MRALNLVGQAEDGRNLLCEEPTSGERFTLPAGPELRAALRQATFEENRGAAPSWSHPRPAGRADAREAQLEPSLRPREIQSRIRAGATLEQVADEAGCDPARIERFAFPVLMERSMIADRARQARPLIDGNPAVASVEKLVLTTLKARGHASTVQWDAWRGDSGAWELVLTWVTGRSENTARWTFAPSAAGGSLTALDDAAVSVVDPAPRPLRTVPEAFTEYVPAPPVNPLVIQPSAGTTGVAQPAPVRQSTETDSGAEAGGSSHGGPADTTSQSAPQAHTAPSGIRIRAGCPGDDAHRRRARQSRTDAAEPGGRSARTPRSRLARDTRTRRRFAAPRGQPRTGRGRRRAHRPGGHALVGGRPVGCAVGGPLTATRCWGGLPPLARFSWTRRSDAGEEQHRNPGGDGADRPAETDPAQNR